MPNLPTATVESDLQTIHDTFETDKLQPDYIKIYPCMVVPTTELAEMYKKDNTVHTAYSDEELIELLIECKKLVPEYCRIIRILRDFPSELVLEGSKTLNLRQIIHDRGIKCKCVRCREIKGQKFDNQKVQIRETWYKANQGEEIFIQAEEPNIDKLIGLVRLRLTEAENSSTNIAELQGKTALIRELHVYGQQNSLGKKRGEVLKSDSQHQGFGKKLMQHAEKIATEKGYDKIAVICAIGTREYYKKLGYSLEGTYMTKKLS
jgi:elongator complex protein 3